MIQNIAVSFPAQVKVAVIGQVDVRGLVTYRFIIDAQFIAGSQGKGGSDGFVSRKTPFAVGTVEGHHHAVFLLFSLPHLAVETVGARVDAVGPVVFGKLVFPVAEGKGSTGDPVCKRPHGRTVAGPVLHIVGHGTESQYHIGRGAVFPGNHQGDNFRSVIGQGNTHTLVIDQCKQGSLLSVDQGVKSGC